VDPLSAVLSGIAVLVSVVFGVVSYRTTRQQNAFQERLVNLEHAREQDRVRETRSADVRASIQRDSLHWRESRLQGRQPQHWLSIRNEGSVTARKVRVLLDGRPALQHQLIPRGEDEINILGPGAESRYVLAVTLGGPRVLDVRIEWEDDSGEPRRWESQLKV
jgi:hypothetical protein